VLNYNQLFRFVLIGMKVKDIMTKEVISVSPETKIVDVAKILFERNFNGLPVIENGIVLGMITEADLLTKDSFNVHIPSFIKLLSEFKIAGLVNKKEVKRELKTLLRSDARSIMNLNYVYVRPNTNLTELIKIFKDKHVNPIPVVDERKRLKGIVSLADVIKFVGRFREAELDFISTENEV